MLIARIGRRVIAVAAICLTAAGMYWGVMYVRRELHTARAVTLNAYQLLLQTSAGVDQAKTDIAALKSELAATTASVAATTASVAATRRPALPICPAT